MLRLLSEITYTGSRPHFRLPNLGIQQRDWKSPGNLMLKIPVGFDYRTFTELGETETLGGHKENLLRARAQGKGVVTPQETEPHLPVNV